VAPGRWLAMWSSEQVFYRDRRHERKARPGSGSESALAINDQCRGRARAEPTNDGKRSRPHTNVVRVLLVPACCLNLQTIQVAL
jgi:hypothetical protein